MPAIAATTIGAAEDVIKDEIAAATPAFYAQRHEHRSSRDTLLAIATSYQWRSDNDNNGGHASSPLDLIQSVPIPIVAPPSLRLQSSTTQIYMNLGYLVQGFGRFMLTKLTVGAPAGPGD